MDCFPSKLFRKDLKQEEIVFGNGTDSTHRHVVSLTSSTYGVLNLEKKQPIIVKHEFLGDFKRKKLPIHEESTTEVIKELMEGLEEVEAPPVSIRRSLKPMVFLCGFGDLDTKRSPLKFLNQMAASPKKLMRSGSGGGKENNRGLVNRFKWDYNSLKGASKSRNLVENSMKSELRRVDSGGFPRGVSPPPFVFL